MKVVMCLATMLMFMCSCAVHVTIYSAGGKFQPVSNFTELHALTQAPRSYVLLMAILHFVCMHVTCIFLHVDIMGPPSFSDSATVPFTYYREMSGSEIA